MLLRFADLPRADAGLRYRIAPGTEEAVGQMIRGRVQVSELGDGRQRVRLEVGQSWAVYEARDQDVVPVHYQLPFGPDRMGLLWPLTVPFVYAALFMLSKLVRYAARAARR